jgi:hypothetical protein
MGCVNRPSNLTLYPSPPSYGTPACVLSRAPAACLRLR